MELITDEQKKIVVNAGEIGINTETLAYQLGVDEKVIEKELRNPKSEISKLYRTGQELHMTDVYLAMKTEALKGNTEAAKMVIALKKEHGYQKTKRELFGD
jgi:hypothetical protein